MRAEGKAVSIAQLCRWFGVPRSTFYYRPTMAGPRTPVLDPALVATIRTIIEAEPAAGLRMITARMVFTPPLGHYATRLGASIESALVLVPA